MMELEHESDSLVPEPGNAVRALRVDVEITIPYGPGCRFFQTADDVQERTFPHTGSADDCQHFPFFDLQVNAGENMEGLVAAPEILPELVYVDQGGGYFFSPGFTDSMPFSTVFSTDEALSSTFCLI